MQAPLASYRLQLHAGFPLDAAAGLVPYLSELGISHLYLSPILQAEAGSTHGYDVVDHSRINQELGGADAFDRLVAAARQAGMGLVVDVVPNHMAIGPANRWWWDVLEHGPASRFARYFDVDWEPPESRLRNVILLPVLEDHYGRVLEANALRIQLDGAALVVAYGEQRYPLDPATLEPMLAEAAAACGSEELAFVARSLGELPASTSSAAADLERRHRDVGVLLERLAALLREPGPAAAVERSVEAVNDDLDRLDVLLEGQNYRLAFWRASSRDLGYRRFFDVNSLIGLRVEEPEVFEVTHRLILERVAAGDIQGLRIDHPDGLRDPAGYFARLREAAPAAWIVAEKILEPHESLPDWPIDGTTGYRFANLVVHVLTDAEAEPTMTRIYADVTGAEADWQVVAHEARQVALSESLGSDVNRLTELWLAICEANRRYRDFTRHELHQALRELAACFPVYRTYLRAPGSPVADADRAAIAGAVEAARAWRPDLDPDMFDFLGATLRLEVPGDRPTELALRFQQLTPAAMAKGVEDTAFYRFLRFVAHNEVGGHPGSFGLEADEFHAALARDRRRSPAGMLATSTHDTKRSEDVRARLALLAEAPEAWRAAVRRLSRRAAPHRAGADLPGPKVEYLLFQTLVGAWPLNATRALGYMEKATRESKERTSWTSPDEDFDAAVADLVSGCLEDAAFTAELEAVVAPLVAPGRSNALAQVLWKLTAPGVPDLYQGTELWNLSLVDPDNRRAVDFGLRVRLLAELAELDAGQVRERADEGLPKLWLVRHGLALRSRRAADLGPAAGFHPLHANGSAARHAVAYRRGEGVVALATRLPLRLAAAGGWRDTVLPLPPGRWRDVLTGAEHGPGPTAVGELLSIFPVALLERGR